MNKKTLLVFTIPGMAVSLFLVSLLSFADEKLGAKAEPAPPIPPAAAKRYLDFYSSPQLNFAIDPDSISVQPGPDAEVRYALKATSRQGAINISYEGIRCSNRQKTIYAVARADGSWSMTRSPEWSAIYVQGLNLSHATLANGYFCSVSSVAGNAEKIVRRIETKQAMDEPGK
jgi:hypothetical protein